MSLDVGLVIIVLILIGLTISVVFYLLGKRAQWKNAPVIQAIAAVWTGIIIAGATITTADKVAGIFGDGEARALRNEYEYLFGNYFDEPWRLYPGSPYVFKGLTRTEQVKANEVTAGSRNDPSGCLPQILDLRVPVQGFPYKRIVETHDQYVGLGEATGCFYLGSLFERMRAKLDIECRVSDLPPVGPTIILGSRNVTYIHPALFELHWYVENGAVMRFEKDEAVVDREPVYDECLGVAVDYGILSKVRSSITGTDIVICEGIHSYGTQGVVREMAKNAKALKQWLDRNTSAGSISKEDSFQILFRVTVFNGVPKDVEPLETYIW